MDIYYEYMIKKKLGTREIVTAVLLAFLALALTGGVVLLFFMGITFLGANLLFLFGVWWGYVWLIKGLFDEYEYTITNHELDIDVIKGKSRRKRITTINLKKIEFFGNRNNPKIQEFLKVKPAKEYYFVSSKNSENIYVTDVISRKDGSTVRVNIEPNDELLKNIGLANPSAVILEESI